MHSHPKPSDTATCRPELLMGSPGQSSIHSATDTICDTFNQPRGSCLFDHKEHKSPLGNSMVRTVHTLFIFSIFDSFHFRQCNLSRT